MHLQQNTHLPVRIYKNVTVNKQLKNGVNLEKRITMIQAANSDIAISVYVWVRTPTFDFVPLFPGQSMREKYIFLHSLNFSSCYYITKSMYASSIFQSIVTFLERMKLGHLDVFSPFVCLVLKWKGLSFEILRTNISLTWIIIFSSLFRISNKIPIISL